MKTRRVSLQQDNDPKPWTYPQICTGVVSVESGFNFSVSHFNWESLASIVNCYSPTVSMQTKTACAIFPRRMGKMIRNQMWIANRDMSQKSCSCNGCQRWFYPVNTYANVSFLCSINICIATVYTHSPLASLTETSVTVCTHLLIQ